MTLEKSRLNYVISDFFLTQNSIITRLKCSNIESVKRLSYLPDFNCTPCLKAYDGLEVKVHSFLVLEIVADEWYVGRTTHGTTLDSNTCHSDRSDYESRRCGHRLYVDNFLSSRLI
jgi:hypothetical protein